MSLLSDVYICIYIISRGHVIVNDVCVIFYEYFVKLCQIKKLYRLSGTVSSENEISVVILGILPRT